MHHQVEPWNDTAQFCINGHMITGYAASRPEKKQKFCGTCGARTIEGCPQCETPFLGATHNITLGTRRASPDFTVNKTPPPFCRGCGQALPWTAKALQAAAELADLQDQLTDKEKDLLKKGLEDLVRDTPQTTVAVQRFKILAAKAGKTAFEGFRSILISIVTETVKKMLFLTP